MHESSTSHRRPRGRAPYHLFSTVALCAGAFAFAPHSEGQEHTDNTGVAAADPAAPAPPKSPIKSLGTITVNSGQPSSLPGYIPTTIEGITGREIEERINASDAEDALKYFPSLLVRKRNIGDYDHAVLSTRASGTGNSARSLVYADGILLSNLLGNGASFTPRWGLVTPDEIERVDVLYGPFSAAFPGNSVGAVVDYVTRMPDQFEAHAKLSVFSQKFSLYSTRDTYQGNQLSASLGSRAGSFSWWLNVNRLDNDAQPLTFGTKLISTGTPGTGGTPVSGAILGQNPRAQDQWIFGTGTQTSTLQDHAKIKLAWDFLPDWRLSYTFGLWRNDAARHAQTYLRNAAGEPVYSGNVNIGGRQFVIAPAELTPNTGDLLHYAQGISLKSSTQGNIDWEIAASRYDYHRDIVRSPLTALPAAGAGGAGRLTDQRGTGWTTLALRGIWRPAGSDGAHLVDFGLQQDRYTLRTLISNSGNWLSGNADSLFSGFRGETQLTSFYVQDTWRVSRDWRATLGVRQEQWRAGDGALVSATTTLGLGGRDESSTSPKAAIAWQAAPHWVLKASLGRAVRNPTVSELYQGSISATVIVNNDPNLKAEKSWTSELSAERDMGNGNGTMRFTGFAEDTSDALYSQTNVTVFPNVTNIQNVDRIRTRGLEIAWQATDVAIKGLDISASATFASSIIEKNDKFPASVGKWQPRVPRYRASLLATWRHAEAWSFSAGARYSGRQFSQLDNSDVNGYAYTGVSKFFVVDLRARYRIHRQWSASLGVDNANNAEYWNFHPYPNRTLVGEVKFDF